MSSRPQFTPYPVILNGNMAGNLVSAVTIIQKLSQISYSYSWAGTSPVGTVSVQVSNDYTQYSDGTVNNAGTWNTLTFSVNGAPVSSIPVSGNTGNGFLDVDATGAFAMRTIYTSSSGTGTLQAIVSAKVS